jgi:hypothetical protein
MGGFFVVKGELAAWALGLEEDDRLSPDEVAELSRKRGVEAPKRRKRRLGHESYRRLPAYRGVLLGR